MSVKVMVEKVKLELEDAGVKIPKRWLPALHRHTSPSPALPPRLRLWRLRCLWTNSGACQITWFFRSDCALRFGTQACSCALAFEEASADEILASFSSQHRNAADEYLLATCIVWHNGSTCLLRCASQYIRILIQDWRQECSLPSLTSTRLMSLVTTLETLCIHCSKPQQLGSEGNKYNSSSGCIAY